MRGSSTTTSTEAVLLHKLWWRKTFLKKKTNQYRISAPAISPGAMPQLSRPWGILGPFPKKPHLVWKAGRRDVLSPVPSWQSPLGHSWNLILGSWLQQAKFWVGRRVEHISPASSFTSVPSAPLTGRGQGLCVALCCPGWGQSPLSLTQTLARKKVFIHKMTIHPGLLSNSLPPLWSINNIFLATFNNTTPIR